MKYYRVKSEGRLLALVGIAMCGNLALIAATVVHENDKDGDLKDVTFQKEDGTPVTRSVRIFNEVKSFEIVNRRLESLRKYYQAMFVNFYNFKPDPPDTIMTTVLEASSEDAAYSEFLKKLEHVGFMKKFFSLKKENRKVPQRFVKVLQALRPQYYGYPRRKLGDYVINLHPS